MVKNPPTNAGEGGSITGSRRSPAEGNGNPVGAWRATVYGVTKESDMT